MPANAGAMAVPSMLTPPPHVSIRVTVLMATCVVRYGLSSWQLFKACLQRDWVLMQRNAFLYVFKTLQVRSWQQ